MADETTNPSDAGSKTTGPDKGLAPVGAPATSAQAVPEPVILEETITRPAPAKPVPQPAPPANPAVHTTEDLHVPAAPEPKPTVAPPSGPPPAKAEPPAPLAGGFIPPDLGGAAAPVPVPPIPSPAPPVMPVVRKIPLAVPPMPSGPDTTSYPVPVVEKPATGVVRPDIEHLLEDIKLPERRESPNTGSADEEKPARTYDTSLGAVSSEEKQSEPDKMEPRASSPEQEPSQKNAAGEATSFTAPLHTLKSDLQDIVRVKKVSLVRAAALEQDKRRGSRNAEAHIAPQRSRRLFGTLFAVGILIGLGAAALFGVYTIMQERVGTAPAAPQGPSLLFAEATVPLLLTDLSALDLKRLLVQVRAGTGATLGSITNIIPVVSTRNESGAEARSPASLGEFFAALGTHAPPDLLRALGDEFFLGLHTVDENAPLLVIPVTSYERAFAGMLAWESAMNTDLSPFFTPVPDQIAGPGGLPQKRQFEDLVMRNYDVRALKNDAGGIELYYSFPTQNILIIGESPYSFTEVLSRLRAERKL